MKQTRSLAARAGRWSATHRKKAIWGWLAFVLRRVRDRRRGRARSRSRTRLRAESASRAAPTQTIDGAFPSTWPRSWS